jgi:competence protein ComEC
VSSVSIAAQIATLPLGLLYFHQFPNYFVISNLLVIPASFIVLIAGIVLLTFSWISAVAQGIGWILTWVIKIMNMIVFTIDALPGSLTDNIFITPLESILLAGMIVSILLLFEQRKFSYFTLAFIVAIAFNCSRWMFQYGEVDTTRVSVYNVPHHTAIDLTNRGRSVVFQDSVLQNDLQKIAFHIQPGRLMFGVKNISNGIGNIRKVDGGRVFFWNKKLFLWIESEPEKAYPPLSVDYVIISNNSIRSLDVLAAVQRGETIVDSSNSFYLARELKSEAEETNLPLFAVSIQGSYQEKIDL